MTKKDDAVSNLLHAIFGADLSKTRLSPRVMRLAKEKLEDKRTVRWCRLPPGWKHDGLDVGDRSVTKSNKTLVWHGEIGWKPTISPDLELVLVPRLVCTGPKEDVAELLADLKAVHKKGLTDKHTKIKLVRFDNRIMGLVLGPGECHGTIYTDVSDPALKVIEAALDLVFAG